MIFLKRRAMMSRFHFNYKTVAGTGSLILDDCAETNFAHFRLLGNSAQGENPTLENRQEIKSAGRKSKNLFDISKFPFEHDAEMIVIKPSEGQTSVDKGINITEDIKFEENTQYVISYDSYNVTQANENWTTIFTFYYTDGTYRDLYVNHFYGNLKKYFNSDPGKTIRNVAVRNPWKVGIEISKVQIEKGNVATEYEQYTDKKSLDVVITGRNLIDIDALKNENGYMSGAYEKSRDIDHFNIVKGKRYLLITKGKPLVAGDYSSVYFGDETLKYGVNHYDVLGTATGYTSFTSDLKQNRAILTAKKTATITKMILHGKANTRKDDYDVEEFGLFEILEDNTNIDYEPYKEPQTTQIALDEPLRGIGEYKDVVTKDGIVRNILQVRIADYLQKAIYGKPGGRYIFSAVPNCYINYDRKRCMSNVGFTTNQENIAYMLVPYLDNFKLVVSDDDTVETIREKVKDMVVAYTVKEPILEALPTELELALSNLYTNDGTTIITVDSGEVETGIEVEYAVKE